MSRFGSLCMFLVSCVWLPVAFVAGADDISSHGHDISSCTYRKVKGDEMLWYPQTSVFILHEHVAVRMRDPTKSIMQKTQPS